ncbi:unnamed protein product [Rotaria magnacalcarata]
MASCCICHERVFIAECVTFNEKVYHKRCFKCKQCGVLLRLNVARSFNKEPYCNHHSPQTTKPVEVIINNSENHEITDMPPEKPPRLNTSELDKDKATSSVDTSSDLNDRKATLATGYDAFQFQVELAAQNFTVDPITQQKIFRMFSEFNIIVCGPARVGKSSLINAICGRKLAQSNPGLDSCTKAISRFVLNERVQVNDESMTYTYNFWDTPGFESWNENDIRTNFSNIMNKPKSDPLCLIYCASPSCFADTKQVKWILDFCISERKILCALVVTNKWAGQKEQRMAVLQKYKELLSDYHSQTSEDENGIVYFGNVALCTMVNSQSYIDEDQAIAYPPTGVDALIEGIMNCLEDDGKVFHWCMAAIQRKGIINNVVRSIKAGAINVKEFLASLLNNQTIDPILLSLATDQQLTTIEYLVIDHSCNCNALSTIVYYTPKLYHLHMSHSIQYFIINGQFPFSGLNNLLSCLPQLRHISIEAFVNSNDTVKTDDLSYCIQLPYLKYVSCKLNSIDFNKFEDIIKKYFNYVEILRLTTNSDETYLNAKRWQQLIVSHIPYLRIFDMKCQGSIGNKHDIIKQFS